MFTWFVLGFLIGCALGYFVAINVRAAIIRWIVMDEFVEVLGLDDIGDDERGTNEETKPA